MALSLVRPLSPFSRHHLRIWIRYATTQSHLPRLPVPPLDHTLTELIERADMLLSPSQYQRTCKLLTEFFKEDGDGGKLQKHLEHRAATTDNWLNGYLIKYQYLINRNPLPLIHNPGILLPLRRKPKDVDEHLMTASKVAVSMADAVEQMESPDFPTEKMGDVELDMSQFKERFRLTRFPGRKQDTIEKVEEKHRYMVAVHNNQFFKIDLYDSEGNLYKEGQIWRALKEVVAQSPEKGIPLGVLTGDNRDIWGGIYNKLTKDENNKSTLDSIYKALFLLCLDGPSEQWNNYDQVTSDCLNLLHGGGSQRNGANRCYDHEWQWVLTSDGSIGISAGQCLANAWLIHLPMKNAMKFILKPEFLGAEATNIPKMQKLAIKMEENTKKEVYKSAERFDTFIRNFDLNCSRFDNFGKNFIKSCNVSPDSYVQLASGLAFMKLYNQGGYDFENAHSRKFYKGRTGYVRTCFAESMKFNRNMLSPRVSNEEKIQSFYEAAKAHQRRIKMVMINGYSAARHLQGLRFTASELGLENIALFQDPGFAKITETRCFSNQIPAPGRVFAINSIFDFKYSTGFVPLDDEILWVVCNWKNPDLVSARKLYSTICESLEDICKLFKRNGK